MQFIGGLAAACIFIVGMIGGYHIGTKDFYELEEVAGELAMVNEICIGQLKNAANTIHELCPQGWERFDIVNPHTGENKGTHAQCLGGASDTIHQLEKLPTLPILAL